MFLFFLVKDVVTKLCSNSFLSLFCCFVVTRKVANAKLLFTFVTARNRLFFVTVLGIRRPSKIQMMLLFFVLFPYDVTQLSCFLRFLIYATEVPQKNRHYGLFWFDRFCLLFCILSFTSFSVVPFRVKVPT